jgi:hypothetical protein
VLFSGDYLYSGTQERGWDVTPDGDRFLLVKQPPERAPRQIRMVTNWVEELRRKMATAPLTGGQ